MNLSRKRSLLMAFNAHEVYLDLIKRVKQKVRNDISIVYDPETGIQKHFLQGKLLAVKKVSNGTKPDSNHIQ